MKNILLALAILGLAASLSLNQAGAESKKKKPKAANSSYEENELDSLDDTASSQWKKAEVSNTADELSPEGDRDSDPGTMKKKKKKSSQGN